MDIIETSMSTRYLEHTEFDRSKAEITKNKEGQIHSIDDEPAIVFEDGTTVWCVNGIVHREDDYAICFDDMEENEFLLKAYCRNGLLHSKDDKPALEIESHCTYDDYWYKEGKLHRESDAAEIYDTGLSMSKVYWLEGKEVASWGGSDDPQIDYEPMPDMQELLKNKK